MSDVPHLRFPEFTEEWDKCSIQDYGEVVTGNTPPTSHAEYYKNGSCLWASPADLGINKNITETKTKLSFSGFKKTRNIPKGSVLVTCIGSTIGKMGMATETMSTNQQINSIVVNGKSNSNFVYYAICRAFPRYLSEVGVQAVPILSKSNFEKLPNYITCRKEQDKIGYFFNLLDERIATQNKIIEKLESLIKGIIYQTKSIGLAHNTWQKTELKNVLQERNEKNANGYDVCSVSVTQGVVNQIEYLGRSFAAKDTLHYNVVKYGDIVYTKSPTGDFPYGIVKRSNIKCDVAVSPLYGVYKPVNDYVGIILHFYFMQSNNAINYLHPLIQKGAKNTINITNGRFLENTIPLPKKEEETKCLAWVLTSIQNKIILEQDLLHSYQKQKQYLLRQMFI